VGRSHKKALAGAQKDNKNRTGENAEEKEKGAGALERVLKKKGKDARKGNTGGWGKRPVRTCKGLRKDSWREPQKKGSTAARKRTKLTIMNRAGKESDRVKGQKKKAAGGWGSGLGKLGGNPCKTKNAPVVQQKGKGGGRWGGAKKKREGKTLTIISGHVGKRRRENPKALHKFGGKNKRETC